MPTVLIAGSYGFNGPRALAFDGRDLWVANYGGNSLTEVNASDGALKISNCGGYRRV
jgi:hypothetical protein